MQPPALFALITCVGVFTALCTVWDARWMKIPNKVTVPALIAALVFHFARGLWMYGTLVGGLYELFWWSICGFALGFGILFLSFVTGRGRGGDVKFMGALGAWLGPWGTIVVLVCSAVWVVITATVSILLLMTSEGFSRTMNKYIRPQARKKGEPQRVRLAAYAIPVTCAVWTLFALSLFSQYSGKDFRFLGPYSSSPPASRAGSSLANTHTVPS